jgi:hypothetical protein
MVDRETLESSITPAMRNDLSRGLATKPVITVVAELEPDCPRCHVGTHGEYQVRLVIETVEGCE